MNTNITPPSMIDLEPESAVDAAARYWANRAVVCEETAAHFREEAERQAAEAAIYRDSERRWRDAHTALLDNGPK